MLKLVIVLALVVGSVECAAACTPVASAQPPCHHHKQAPACTHELVPATIVQPLAIGVSLESEGVDPQSGARMQLSFRTSATLDSSPPSPPVRISTILRI